MSFSGNVLAHCGDAEAHAVSSQEHIEKDSANELSQNGDEKKEKKSYKNNMRALRIIQIGVQKGNIISLAK